MAHRLCGVLTALVIAIGTATAAHAGVAPADTCKDKKGKETGKKVLGLLKGFGKNIKVTNLGKLASDLSKAQSKFTKGFTKAEFTGSGQSKGCETIEDADEIEAKVDVLVFEAIATFNPVCGDNIKGSGEACDGTDDAGCPGLCNPNCTCPACGNLVVDGLEQCDSTPCCVAPTLPGECTFELSGTGCGSPSDTDCTNPDTCNGAGTCLANHESSGFACGSPADTDCTNPDTCNGSGTCLVNDEIAGFACGNPADTECTNPDTCNGSGTCLANDASGGAPCGDQGIDCRINDTCDGAGACTDNGFSPVSTPCGSPANTECTDPDTCNGSGTCLANHASGGAPCGDQGIDCRINDTCDGAGACTDNGFSPVSTPCGSPANTECTNPDTCNGSGTCLVNDEIAGFACGSPANTDCTNPDTCNGSGTCLLNDEIAGFACGSPANTDCTNPDTCNGTGTCLLNDEIAGFACGSPANTDCTNPDTCNGSGTCLLNDEIAGFACGSPANTDCTNPDTCNGSGTCLLNDEIAGFACGSPADTDCTNPDTCNGTGTCLANDASNGTPCNDADACTSTDLCNGTGTCVGQAATRLNFTTGLPGGLCGRINDDVAGTGTDLTPYGASAAQLDCGTLYIGGGGSTQPPSPTPDGAANILKVDSCSAGAITLAAATSVETGSNRNCTAPGCLFGPPLPIPNAGSPGASTCIINAIAASPAVGGALNATTGVSTQTLPLRVTVRVTGDLETANPGIQPCPTCTGGTCDSGANSGGTCTTPTSLLTTHDCPITTITLAPFNVDLSPLTTGLTTLTSGTGVFCPGPPVQRTAGCFGNPTCEYIEENGVPAGNLAAGPALASTLASAFCIAKSSAPLINSVADLPGPGAVTLKGSADLTP